MKIAKLSIKNFLKLEDVEMNPSHTNVIVGKNKQGKTSILKAIKAAFEGGAGSDSIRVGETKAEITVELDDLTIRRSVTEKGNQLDISNKEGFKVPAPQKYLDGILGTFSFNPIEFFELKAADRKKYLLSALKLVVTPEQMKEWTGFTLTGIDFTKHALEVVADAHKFFYDKRAVANAEVTKKRKSLEDLNASIPEGFNPKNVSDEKIAQLRKQVEIEKIARTESKANDEAILKLERDVEDYETQIHALEEKKKKSLEDIKERKAKVFQFSDDLSLGAVEDTIKALEGQREIVFTVKRAEEVRGELSTAVEEAGRLEVIVKKLSKEVPQALIEKADLPIKGLAVVGDDITINNISLDNLSSSEQLKFGLDLVRALNANFKVICIDGVERLDKESFESVLKEIEGDDYQYFITRVDGDTPHSFVVENGKVTQNG